MLHIDIIGILPLAANTAPVIAPLPMEFHGSSLPLNPIRQQSKVENNPPHTAKLPAIANRKLKTSKNDSNFILQSVKGLKEHAT